MSASALAALFGFAGEPPPLFYFGQIAINPLANGDFELCHRADFAREDLECFSGEDAALELARHDDSGAYRPLKTAPNLRHGWKLLLREIGSLRRALDAFYPGRLAALEAWQKSALTITPLRTTLDRQTGMYRVAAKITDAQIDSLVGNFCRSEGGCLRTILWKRDAAGAVPSSLLPPAKFDPAIDQAGESAHALPLLCQEACHLLVAAARAVVKGERATAK